MSGKSLLSLLVGLCAFVVSTSAFAEGPNSLDELERGTVQRDSLELADVINDSFANQLLKDVADNCLHGKCTLATISTRNKGVSLQLGCGEGNMNGANGTTYYIGGGTGQQKTDGTNCYAGLTIKNEKCSAEFKVPQSDFVNFVRYNLAQRVEGAVVEMNRLNPEYEFQKRLQLEFARTLQNACGNK